MGIHNGITFMQDLFRRLQIMAPNSKNYDNQWRESNHWKYFINVFSFEKSESEPDASFFKSYSIVFNFITSFHVKNKPNKKKRRKDFCFSGFISFYPHSVVFFIFLPVFPNSLLSLSSIFSICMVSDICVSDTIYFCHH